MLGDSRNTLRTRPLLSSRSLSFWTTVAFAAGGATNQSRVSAEDAPDGFDDVCALHTSVVNSVKQTKAFTTKNCREMILLIKNLSNVTEVKSRGFISIVDLFINRIEIQKRIPKIN